MKEVTGSKRPARAKIANCKRSSGDSWRFLEKVFRSRTAVVRFAFIRAPALPSVLMKSPTNSTVGKAGARMNAVPKSFPIGTETVSVSDLSGTSEERMKKFEDLNTLQPGFRFQRVTSA